MKRGFFRFSTIRFYPLVNILLNSISSFSFFFSLLFVYASLLISFPMHIQICWAQSAVQAGDEILQGTFPGYPPFIMNVVSLPLGAAHVVRDVEVSFTFWSLDQWHESEKAYLLINGQTVWSKMRPSSVSCTDWTPSTASFPAITDTHFQCTTTTSVTVSLQPSLDQVVLEFGSTINGDTGEQWAVSAVSLVVLAAGPQPSSNLLTYTRSLTAGWSASQSTGQGG